MKNTIVLATRNRHKVEEIKLLFSDSVFNLISLSDLPAVPEVEETGETFIENAVIKARQYYLYHKIAVISEDSGLVVPSLNGAPGIYSARYAGEEANYKANNKKLLAEMTDFAGTKRRAYFVCCAVYWDKNTSFSAEGRIDGLITEQESGQSGFGYDPVFLVPDLGKTLAELEPAHKNRISHRHMAFSILKEMLATNL